MLCKGSEDLGERFWTCDFGSQLVGLQSIANKGGSGFHHLVDSFSPLLVPKASTSDVLPDGKGPLEGGGGILEPCP